jgi:hypothetical protein
MLPPSVMKPRLACCLHELNKTACKPIRIVLPPVVTLALPKYMADASNYFESIKRRIISRERNLKNRQESFQTCFALFHAIMGKK